MLKVVDIIVLIDGSDSFNIKVDADNISRTDKNSANSFPGNSLIRSSNQIQTMLSLCRRTLYKADHTIWSI